MEYIIVFTIKCYICINNWLMTNKNYLFSVWVKKFSLINKLNKIILFHAILYVWY